MAVGMKFFLFWACVGVALGQAGNRKFYEHIEMMKMISSQQDSLLLSPAAGYEDFDLMNFYDRMMGLYAGGGASNSTAQHAAPQLCQYIGAITRNTSESCQKSMQKLVCEFETFVKLKLPINHCMTLNGTLDEECAAKKAALEGSLLYSAKVFDAFGKYPSGIFTGDFLWLGTYAECLHSGAPSENPVRYCSANIGTKPTKLHLLHQYCTIPYQMVKDALANMEPVCADQVPKPVSLGMCLPQVCSTEDVSSMLNFIGHYAGICIDEDSVHCEASEPLNLGAILLIIIFAVIGICLTIGSIYDIYVFRPFIKQLPKAACTTLDEATNLLIENGNANAGDAENHPHFNVPDANHDEVHQEDQESPEITVEIQK